MLHVYHNKHACQKALSRVHALSGAPKVEVRHNSIHILLYVFSIYIYTFIHIHKEITQGKPQLAQPIYDMCPPSQAPPKTPRNAQQQAIDNNMPIMLELLQKQYDTCVSTLGLMPHLVLFFQYKPQQPQPTQRQSCGYQPASCQSRAKSTSSSCASRPGGHPPRPFYQAG